MKRATRLLGAVFGLVVVVTASACGSSVETLSFPAPPATTPVTQASPPTLPDNLSSVSQAAVAGVTTTTAPVVGPGGASLNGTVFGTSGPVAGATVEADRLVGDSVATTRTTTAADGSWTISDVLGGRYRVRAWQSPSLDMTTPEVVFLSATQTLSLPLQLTQFQGPTVASAISPSVPVMGDPVNLVVQVTDPTVGTDGVLKNPPDTGASVTLTNGPDWQFDDTPSGSTDGAGDVTFEVTCTAAGLDPLSVEVGTGAPLPLQLPLCAVPPTPTTTTTTIPCPTTTTSSVPPGVATTTSNPATGGC